MSRSTLPTNLLLTQPTVVKTFDTLADWSLTRFTSSLTTGVTWNGITGINFTKVSDANLTSRATCTIAEDFSNVGVMSVVCHIPDKTNISSISLTISSTTDFSKTYTKTFASAWLRNGINHLRVGMQYDTWSNVSGESFLNSFIRMRVEVTYGSNVTDAVTFFRIDKNAKGIPKMIFTFDDAKTGVINLAYPLFETKGIKGVTWVTKNFSEARDEGMAGYDVRMSTAELTTLYNAGWDVSNHTTTHPDDVTGLTYDEVFAEYNTCTQWLKSLGFARSAKFLCYPSGSYNDNALLAARNAGIVAGRTIDVGHINMPAEDIMLLRTVSIGPTTTFVNLRDYIDRAHNLGATIIFMLHDVVDSRSPGLNQTDVQLIESVINYIQSRRIDIVTISEWYDQLTNPRMQVSRS